MQSNNKIKRCLMNLDIIIAAIALIVLVSTTFFGVLMRYFFNNPFVWLQEVQLWCFTWVVFFGVGAAFRTGSHVAIEFIVDHMRPTMRKITEVFGYIVSICVIIYFFIHGTDFIKQLINTNRTTNILDIPYPLIYMAFPICCILMIINYSLTMKKVLFNKADIKGGE
ncbi:TRAP transporter permease [Vallitalea longa]|uniref:TRAP transporter permease n=1 Tax=Vallitalea longa TaxID=2936439 RepID=A0A9W5Y758_9FIRM|nr:TRAP transporter small permease [Vallitalea longa]GKX27742.1 TRAP transporter permease [Vallitalea longa]